MTVLTAPRWPRVRVRRGNKIFLSKIFELFVNLYEWWAVSSPGIFVDWNLHYLVDDLQH